MQNRNVQSVLIPKTFKLEQAIEWLDTHSFIHQKLHTTDNFFRFRQFEPSDDHKYRIISLSNGVKLVVNMAKGGGVDEPVAVCFPKEYGEEFSITWLLKNGFSIRDPYIERGYLCFLQNKYKEPRGSIVREDGIVIIL